MEKGKGKNMQKVDMSVKGKNRRVYLEKAIDSNSWRARLYIGSSVVSGKLVQYTNGAKRFYPIGKNAGLI